MKKIFAFVLVFAIAIAVMGAGTTVLDLRKTVGATGVLFADTLKGVFVGGVNSATSDLTVDDITCNTITADTIAGGLVTGDLTIGAGKELYADSAVIDTAVIAVGSITALTAGYVILDSTDAFLSHGDITIGAGYELNCDSAVIDTLVTAVGSITALTAGYVILDSTDAFLSHGDITIGAGYELNCDSAVIDTLATSVGAIASLTSSTLITSAKDSTIVLKVMSGMTLADTIRILDVDTFGTDKTCDTFVNTKIATGAFALVTWKTQPDSATAISAICLTDSLFVTVNKTETGGIYQFMIVNP
jgi:hypothetical protein